MTAAAAASNKDGVVRAGSMRRATAVTAVVLLCLAHAAAARADTPLYSEQEILAVATSTVGAAVQFTPPSGSSVSCDHAPGSTFPVGTTLVTCTAPDPAAGTPVTVGSFRIRVLARPQEEARTARVEALLYYTKKTSAYGLPQFRDFHLVIVHDHEVVYDGPVRPYPGPVPTVWPANVGSGRSLRLRDLDGDGEPELLLDLYWGGAHCCRWTDVFRSVPAGYTFTSHFWGDLGYRLVYLIADDRDEFESGDDRFAYAFASFADSLFPIQIWRYESGRFENRTRAFPERIRADAARQWRIHTSLRRSGRSARGALAAWVADECLLGRCAASYARVTRLDRRVLVSPLDFDPPAEYLRRLRRLLHALGYWR